jgi:uncharacterized protein YecT (DUF1311 family)
MKLAALSLAAGLAAVAPTAADEAFDACLKTAAAQDTHCGEAWLKREQARLDAVWQQLGQMADGHVAEALVAEQRAWEAFRDVSCSFKLDEGFGAAAGPNGFHACRAEVIAQRAKALEAYISYIDN